MKNFFESVFVLPTALLALAFVVSLNGESQEEMGHSGTNGETVSQNNGYVHGSELWFAAPGKSAQGYQDEDKIGLRLAELASKHEKDPFLMVLVAQHLESSGDDASAIVWLRKAADILGDTSESFPVNIQFLLGRLLGRSKDFKSAISALEAARRSKLYPGNAEEIDGELASSYAAAGRLEDALIAITKAIQDSPGDRRSWLLYLALKRDSKVSGPDAMSKTGQHSDAEQTLNLGFVGNWPSTSIMENSDIYLHIAGNLTQQGYTHSARNYRYTIATVALFNAKKAVIDAKYDEALGLFSIADRAVELSSLDRNEQENLLPFLTTAYLAEGRTLAALKVANSFKHASSEMLLGQYTRILDYAFARISWNLNTHERILDDPQGFADLFGAIAIDHSGVGATDRSSSDRKCETESDTSKITPAHCPKGQLSKFWRSDFRYGMTNPDEDFVTLDSELVQAHLLLGQEIDFLLAQGKPELPAKVFLLELGGRRAPIIGLLAPGSRISANDIQSQIMTPERIEHLYSVIRTAKPDEIRPETIEAVAVGQSLLKILSAER